MKKWDIFIGPGNGFEDLKSSVDRTLFIIEKLHFLGFFKSTIFDDFWEKFQLLIKKPHLSLIFLLFLFCPFSEDI